MTFDATQISYMTLAGLAWDLSAAWFLAKALFWTDAKRITAESAAALSYSPAKLRAVCEVRIDARYGVTQLGFGFMLQALSAAGVFITVVWMALLILPIVLVWHRHSRISTYTAAVDAMRSTIGFGPTYERVWRKHFLDMADVEWRNAANASGIIFKEEVPEKSGKIRFVAGED